MDTANSAAAQHLPPDDDYVLLTPGEVAEYFRVDPKTVSRWAADDKFPATPTGYTTVFRTVGGHHRFRASGVRAMLTGQ